MWTTFWNVSCETSSAQAAYRSFPREAGKLIHSAAPPLQLVDGNTLTLKCIDKLEWNEDDTHVRCIMSNTSFTYTFSFQGRKLTLTNGTDTVEMYSGLDIDTDEPYVTLDNYLHLGAEKLMGMYNLYALFMGPSEYDDNSYIAWPL